MEGGLRCAEACFAGRQFRRACLTNLVARPIVECPPIDYMLDQNEAVPSPVVHSYSSGSRIGEPNFGSHDVGGTVFVAAELFQFMIGTNITFVPNKQTGVAIIGLIARAVSPFQRPWCAGSTSLSRQNPDTVFPCRKYATRALDR